MMTLFYMNMDLKWRFNHIDTTCRHIILSERAIKMRVLYGTTNQAKLYSMRQAVSGLGLEVIGLKELELPIPHVDESGKDPQVNAELKARAYYEAFHLPVFSCDSLTWVPG